MSLTLSDHLFSRFFLLFFVFCLWSLSYIWNVIVKLGFKGYFKDIRKMFQESLRGFQRNFKCVLKCFQGEIESIFKGFPWGIKGGLNGVLSKF